MDEACSSAMTELRLIMSYSDNNSKKTPSSQTSNFTSALITSHDVMVSDHSVILTRSLVAVRGRSIACVT